MHPLSDFCALLPFPLQAFPDNAARREVESLPAVCINEGCTWKGTIKEYEVNPEEGLLVSAHFFFPLCANRRGSGGVCFLLKLAVMGAYTFAVL